MQALIDHRLGTLVERGAVINADGSSYREFLWVFPTAISPKAKNLVLEALMDIYPVADVIEENRISISITTSDPRAVLDIALNIIRTVNDTTVPNQN